MVVWLDGLVYCMLFSKIGIYRPVNTLINARQGPRDDWTTGPRTVRRQGSSVGRSDHRKRLNGIDGSTMEVLRTRVKKNQLPWERRG